MEVSATLGWDGRQHVVGGRGARWSPSPAQCAGARDRPSSIIFCLRAGGRPAAPSALACGLAASAAVSALTSPVPPSARGTARCESSTSCLLSSAAARRADADSLPTCGAFFAGLGPSSRKTRRSTISAGTGQRRRRRWPALRQRRWAVWRCGAGVPWPAARAGYGRVGHPASGERTVAGGEAGGAAPDLLVLVHHKARHAVWAHHCTARCVAGQRAPLLLPAAQRGMVGMLPGQRSHAPALQLGDETGVASAFLGHLA